MDLCTTEHPVGSETHRFFRKMKQIGRSILVIQLVRKCYVLTYY